MAKKVQMEARQEAEMSLEEARAYRASLYKPVQKTMSEQQKREAFRVFWALEKSKFAKGKKDLESLLWLHLKSSGFDEPEDFTKGLLHFGLKKIR